MSNSIKYFKNKIIINNNLNIKFHGVRIKLRVTDDWIDLGEIVEGVNQYQINDEPTELDRGILQVRQPNGQYFNAGFKKIRPNLSLDLMISSNIFENLKTIA